MKRATRKNYNQGRRPIRFQSTLSMKRATWRGFILSSRYRVSIHALNEESDMNVLLVCPSIGVFQSTLSMKRATRSDHDQQPSSRVSIHALNEESDIVTEQ